MDTKLENAIKTMRMYFSEIYFQGTSHLLNFDPKQDIHKSIPNIDGGVFLSCICVCTGIEALAGYRYPEDGENGSRFKKFVSEYFPPPYNTWAKELWRFRNNLVHAFNPGRDFVITHQLPDKHLQKQPDGCTVLMPKTSVTLFVRQRRSTSKSCGQTKPARRLLANGPTIRGKEVFPG